MTTSQGLEGELLTCDNRPGHETSDGMDESDHPVDVMGFRIPRGLGAGTGTGTGGSGLSLGPRGYGDGLSVGAKLEIAPGKLIIDCVFGPVADSKCKKDFIIAS